MSKRTSKSNASSQFWLGWSVIKRRVDCLAVEIADAYYGRVEPLVVIGVLDGAEVFVKNLLGKLEKEAVERDSVGLGWMTITSYDGVDQLPGGAYLEKLTLPQGGLFNCDVLIVDDILDSGKTMQLARKIIQDHRPSSIRSAVLLRKIRSDVVGEIPEFVGFTIPDVFVVGYGMDYMGQYRDLAYIQEFKREVSSA